MVGDGEVGKQRFPEERSLRGCEPLTRTDKCRQQIGDTLVAVIGERGNLRKRVVDDDRHDVNIFFEDR